MSSIINRSNGTREIRFVYNGLQTLRLGRVTKRQAEGVKVHVGNLLAWRLSGQNVPPSTLDWLAGVSVELRSRLEAKKLIDPAERREVPTVRAWIDRYIEGRKSIKGRTRENFEVGRDRLLKYIAGDALLDRVTAGAAVDAYHAMLGDGYADSTARKTISRARQIFAHAVKHDLVSKNPFDGLAVTMRENRERDHFVTREEIEAVIGACPSTEWKLIFAMARFGGLRTPSETFGLRWGDVDWEGRRIAVRSPKTAHHDGKAERVIPLFPELADLLQTAFDEAPDGSEYILPTRTPSSNLRTHARRIIRRAGLEPWAKVFHNCRSSRQTELAETFPIQCVCAWLGNSAAIARKHYLQVTSDHWAKATSEAHRKAHHNAHLRTTAIGGHGLPAVDAESISPDVRSGSQPVAAGCTSAKYPPQDSNLKPAD